MGGLSTKQQKGIYRRSARKNRKAKRDSAHRGPKRRTDLDEIRLSATAAFLIHRGVVKTVIAVPDDALAGMLVWRMMGVWPD
jgi:hypothetical protein